MKANGPRCQYQQRVGWMVVIQTRRALYVLWVMRHLGMLERIWLRFLRLLAARGAHPNSNPNSNPIHEAAPDQTPAGLAGQHRRESTI